MKLKKIVSLALAGVMAVSMLAGCANNGGNGGNDSGKEPVTQPATGVAAAFNDAQSSTNKAKVVFSNDASLDAALSQAVKAAGQGAGMETVEGYVAYITGVVGSDKFATTNDDSKDGLVLTKVYTQKYNSSSNSVWTEEAAVNKMAAEVDKEIKTLVDTTYSEEAGKETEAGDTYYDYSYTGTASMVSVENTRGYVDYYFIYTITQTCKAEVL